MGPTSEKGQEREEGTNAVIRASERRTVRQFESVVEFATLEGKEREGLAL